MMQGVSQSDCREHLSNYNQGEADIRDLEFKFFLQTVLQKVDNASMANGLEVRAPFLSHEFINAERDTRSASVRYGRGKQQLRALHRNFYGGARSAAAKRGFTPALEMLKSLEEIQ